LTVEQGHDEPKRVERLCGGGAGGGERCEGE